MVKSYDIFKKEIRIINEDFNINSLYKNVRGKIDELRYVYLEKKQTTKPKKYGQEIKFEISLSKEVDDFCVNEINIEMFFENINKPKSHDHGDARILVKAKQTFDYKNRWGMSKFNMWLFKIYLLVKKLEFEEKYTVPIINDATQIYNLIKESLGAT